MAETVQAAPRAQPPGRHVECEAGGAVQQTGRRVHGKHQRQDVCGQRKPGSGVGKMQLQQAANEGGIGTSKKWQSNI